MEDAFAVIAGLVTIAVGIWYLTKPPTVGRLRQPPPPPASNCHRIDPFA